MDHFAIRFGCGGIVDDDDTSVASNSIHFGGFVGDFSGAGGGFSLDDDTTSAASVSGGGVGGFGGGPVGGSVMS